MRYSIVCLLALASCGHEADLGELSTPDSERPGLGTGSGTAGSATERLVGLAAVNGPFVVAEEGGGGAVNANRAALGPWETFTLIDFDGGALEDGDAIALRTHDGVHYVVAEGGGGREVLADRTWAGPWETFQLKRVAGPGIIRDRTAVALRAAGGQWLCAEEGGGSVVNANRAAVGPWETFTLYDLGSPQPIPGPGPGPGPAPGSDLVLDDPLDGSTRGDRRGGTFVDGGWRADGHTDAIIWHIPTLTEGAVEFSVRGLRPNECRPGMNDKAELFHMYDWQAGDADNLYSQAGDCNGYRDTPFKHFIRKAGCIEAARNKEDTLELLWQLECHDIDPDLYDETDSAKLSWDPGTTYRFREEWGVDAAGNGFLRTYRDGVLLKTMTVGRTWNPRGHAVRIGASPRSFISDSMGAPEGAIYSDVKVWRGTGGSTDPGCSGCGGDGVGEGEVRVVGNSLVDDGGPFLGLGFSYFSALRLAKYDRARFHSDMAFMSSRGFNFMRILSMVGHHPSWLGLEIAPVTFNNRDGVRVAAWPDYWQQLADVVDIAYDDYGVRTQITIFADAQLMPTDAARYAHMDRILGEIVAGREHKVILLEVANEAYQNGFTNDTAGKNKVKLFGDHLADRTDVPVALTAWHNDGTEGVVDMYADTAADIATWHFSRTLSTGGGWTPVRDCWYIDAAPGVPPASSNEPIGPGSSVNSENDPVKLVSAAIYAFIARLPMYVFHSSAGVRSQSRFEDMAGVSGYRHLPALLPGGLASWTRWNGGTGSVLRLVSGGVELVGARSGAEMVALVIGVGSGGAVVEAREAVSFRVVDPLTAAVVAEHSLGAGQRITVPGSSQAYVLTNAVVQALPTVALTAPADGAVVDTWAPLQLVAAVTGEPASVSFHAGGALIGTDGDGSDGWSVSWGSVPPGEHELTAVAATSGGTMITSNSIRVIDRGSLRLPENPGAVAPGLSYTYFEGDWVALPAFTSLWPVASGTSATFDLGVRQRDDYFGLVFQGYLEVPVDGVYGFATSSDDGSYLDVGTTRVIDNDGLHDIQQVQGRIPLRAGRHRITVGFFDRTLGHFLEVHWQTPGAELVAVPAEALTH